MRTIEKFAFGFGIANLALGAMSLFSPFVKPEPRHGVAKILPRRKQHGLINKRTGQLLGGMGAVNPPQAIMHSTLGAAGLATRKFPNLARPFMWLSGLVFLGLAAMGWSSMGTRSRTKKVRGIALDRKENIIHTLFGAASLLMAAKPNLFSGGRATQYDAMHLAEAGFPD